MLTIRMPIAWENQREANFTFNSTENFTFHFKHKVRPHKTSTKCAHKDFKRQRPSTCRTNDWTSVIIALPHS